MPVYTDIANKPFYISVYYSVFGTETVMLLKCRS